MTATRAFDLALFTPQTPVNAGDGVTVAGLGPPFTTQFMPLVTSPGPGVVVQASVPAANAVNQILVSGAGPGYAWGLGTNPSVAASVPAPTAANQLLMSNAGLTWADTAISTVLGLGGAITNASGAAFVATANVVFTAAASLTTRIDGGDPAMSRIDNFSIDMGTF